MKYIKQGLLTELENDVFRAKAVLYAHDLPKVLWCEQPTAGTQFGINYNQETGETTAEEWVDPKFLSTWYYSDGSTYKENVAGELTYSIVARGDGKHTEKYYNEIVAFEMGDNVTSVGSGAFSGCNSLTSITIGENVTYIGQQAFNNCSQLVSINSNEIGKCVIPNNVKAIDDYGFYYDSSLTEIYIPEGVTSIGKCAFYECSKVQKITFNPTSPCTIGNECFYGCNALTTFNSDVEGICNIDNPNFVLGDKVFYNCNNITNLYYNLSVVPKWTFYQPKLKQLVFGDNVQTISQDAFYLGNNRDFDENACIDVLDTNKISMAEFGFTNISVDTFILNSEFTTLQSVHGIVNDASPINHLVIKNKCLVESDEWNSMSGFYSYAKLQNIQTDITVDCDAVRIGKQALSGTYAKKIYLPNTVKEIADKAFAYSSYATEIEIPSNVEIIGASAFNGCQKLTSITIPDGVTEIKDSTFNYCYSLTSITIPDGVTSIGNEAFRDCSGFTSVVIPNNVNSIGHRAFYGCNGLTSLTISNSLTSIGAVVFDGCSNLQDIYCDSVNEPCEAISGTFSGIAANGVLHVKKGGSIENWSTWMNNQGNLGYAHWTLVDDID